VLGSPITHSLSPALHTAAYSALGLADWEYTAHDVDEGGLAGFIDNLDRSWVGLSLTMPLKQAVIPMLAEVDDLVRVTGSCNTVLLDGMRGVNTDVDGLVSALAEAGTTGTTRPVILGGGATAASAVAAVHRMGAPAVTVMVRDPLRAGAAQRTATALGLACDIQRLDLGALPETDLVISTMPAGATDLPVGTFSPVTATLLDVVYDPWPTSLARQWQIAGGRALSGDVMLLHQAARQVTLMTGRPAPVAAMRTGMTAERLRRLGDPA